MKKILLIAATFLVVVLITGCEQENTKPCKRTSTKLVPITHTNGKTIFTTYVPSKVCVEREK